MIIGGRENLAFHSAFGGGVPCRDLRAWNNGILEYWKKRFLAIVP
jgi:hypothetical protein